MNLDGETNLKLKHALEVTTLILSMALLSLLAMIRKVCRIPLILRPRETKLRGKWIR